jgi:transposase
LREFHPAQHLQRQPTRAGWKSKLSDQPRHYLKGNPRDQTLLLPRTVDEYIDPENEARFIDVFVGGLDLKRLGFTHTAPLTEGRPPYDPSDMLRIYVWGYLNQVRSSRKLERECGRNLEAIWLMKGLAPDHWTIAAFRRENAGVVKAVFRELVKLLIGMGLVGRDLVAVDGVKLKAVNSNERNLNRKTLAMNIERMDAAVAGYLKALDKADREEERGVGEAARLRGKLGKVLERRGEAAELLGKLEEFGEKEVSLTDPDCRLMRNRGRFEPCYNAHAAVDTGSHIVVEYDVSNSASDAHALSPVATAAKKTLGVEKLKAVADKGFHDASEVARCLDDGVTPYVPRPDSYARGRGARSGVPTRGFRGNRFTYDKGRDAYVCPAGNLLTLRGVSEVGGRTRRTYRSDACSSCPYYVAECTRNRLGRVMYRYGYEDLLLDMEERLRAEPQVMEARRATVEHVFGSVKRPFNQGYLLLRGLGRVVGEVGLTMLVYDLRRAISLVGVGGLVAYISV